MSKKTKFAIGTGILIVSLVAIAIYLAGHDKQNVPSEERTFMDTRSGVSPYVGDYDPPYVSKI